MANLFIPAAKATLLSAGINVPADTMQAVLVSSAYTYNAAHANLSDLGANVIGSPVTLTGKSVAGGLVDFDDVVFPSVASGSTVGSIYIIKSTGTASTSPLFLRLDTPTGLPLTTNGQNITYTTPSGGVQF